MKILIVDDNKDISDLLENIISESFQVQEVIVSNHGAEALLACMKHTFDLIVTDYEMPVINGMEFLSILRNLQIPNQSVPVIFLSAFVPIIQDSAKVYENVFFIDKPVEFNKFLKLISILIKSPIRKII
ncbi:MAG TPA: response regulator [Oligoflexus sp.]|uniref:response regulator n=1 Tax=Oligoflexus sp. TaxID=1971216 RepID=UPI002D40C62F|nr:response regulator [Oligoflexus sp.]HYX34702.1 response regulator [Oligoflexus sp.]